MVSAVNPKFKLGQQVRITKPVDCTSASIRDCTLEPYIGRTGCICKFFWIGPRPGEIFFVYLVSVRINEGEKHIILHEDEMELILA